MADTAPHITYTQDSGERWAQLRGRWGAAELGRRTLWREVRDQLAQTPPAARQAWDLTTVDWLDHVGAQLLWDHWQQQWPAQVRVTDMQRQMLDRVASLTMVCPPAPQVNWFGWLIQLGQVLLDFLHHIKSLVQMVGQLLLDYCA